MCQPPTVSSGHEMQVSRGQVESCFHSHLSHKPHGGKIIYKCLINLIITFVHMCRVLWVYFFKVWNQCLINWYVVWNKNNWIPFYLHCLIFVWGVLLSFSSAVVKFCFNFCHYHKEIPLVIIWAEESASVDSVELRLHKLPGKDIEQLLICYYFTSQGCPLGELSCYSSPVGLESYLYTFIHFLAILRKASTFLSVYLYIHTPIKRKLPVKSLKIEVIKFCMWKQWCCNI